MGKTLALSIRSLNAAGLAPDPGLSILLEITGQSPTGRTCVVDLNGFPARG